MIMQKTKKKIETKFAEIEKEFPDDFALQQIHLARKKLREESVKKNLSFSEYIISLRKSKRQNKSKQLK